MARSRDLRETGKSVARAPYLLHGKFARSTEFPLQGYRRAYLYHVRKTAGTSLAYAFLGLGGEPPSEIDRRMRRFPHVTRSGSFRFVQGDPALLRQGGYFFGYGHHPVYRIDVPPGTFTMTVLRDPSARVISLYRYLADETADSSYAFRPTAQERQRAADGFSVFLDRLPEHHLMNQLHMFSKSHSVAEAVDTLSSIDRVLLTDSFRVGVEGLARDLSLPLTVRAERASVGTRQPDDRDLARLREMLEPEYQMLAGLQASTAEQRPRAGQTMAGDADGRPGGATTRDRAPDEAGTAPLDG